jgi:hypothetical protein
MERLYSRLGWNGSVLCLTTSRPVRAQKGYDKKQRQDLSGPKRATTRSNDKERRSKDKKIS